jgi:hypothetical protein
MASQVAIDQSIGRPATVAHGHTAPRLVRISFFKLRVLLARPQCRCVATPAGVCPVPKVYSGFRLVGRCHPDLTKSASEPGALRGTTSGSGCGKAAPRRKLAGSLGLPPGSGATSPPTGRVRRITMRRRPNCPGLGEAPLVGRRQPPVRPSSSCQNPSASGVQWPAAVPRRDDARARAIVRPVPTQAGDHVASSWCQRQLQRLGGEAGDSGRWGAAQFGLGLGLRFV